MQHRFLQLCSLLILGMASPCMAAEDPAPAIIIDNPDCSIEAAEAALKRDDARSAARIALKLLNANPSDKKALSVLNRAHEKLSHTDARLVDSAAQHKDRAALLDVDKASIVPALPSPVDRPRFPRREENDEIKRETAAEGKLQERVDADFLEADLPLVLDELFKMTGVNIVADNTALDDKKVTLHVHQMPLIDLLDFLVRKYEGLQYSIKNGNVWITAEETASMKKLMFTRIYPLHYGLVSTTKGEFSSTLGNDKAKNQQQAAPQPQSQDSEGEAGPSYLEALLTWIKKKEDPQIFPTGSDFFIDRQSNQIVVYTTASGHRRIMEMLDRFDQPAMQVLIKTRFLEISVEDEKSLGVNLDSLSTRGAQTSANGTQDTHDPFRALLINGLNRGVPPFIPGNLGPGSVFTFIGRRTDPQYQVTLAALLNDRHTKVLSAPEIIAINNKQSLIDVATKFQYVAAVEPIYTQSSAGVGSTINNVTGYLPKFEPEDVGFKLAVTPSIGRDNQTVTLHLSPSIKSLAEGQQITTFQNVQVSATSGQAQNFPKPTIDETAFETDVVLKDNGFVIIGGLQRKFEEARERKVPGLGDIPWLGRVFKSTNRDVRKNNLIIIVEAHIISREGATYKDDDKTACDTKVDVKSLFAKRQPPKGAESEAAPAELAAPLPDNPHKDDAKTYLPE